MLTFLLTDDVPGALTQGKTIKEAKENLIDAILEMQKPIGLSTLSERDSWRRNGSLKRKELIKHLEQHGCVLLRERAKYSRDEIFLMDFRYDKG